MSINSTQHQHWNNYWSSGAQTSLPQDFKNNYDGEIFEFWSEIVGQLNEGTQVLDLCTGNGAVALILAEAALKQNKKIQITAVDISDINTASIHAKHDSEVTSMIEFISHCPLEKIDNHIHQLQDLVVSQYGMEYSNLNLSAGALAKVIKPSGQLTFIAHGQRSAIFDYMKIEAEIYQWLETIGILKMFSNFAHKGMNDSDLKQKIHQITSRHQPKQQFHSHPLFQSWLNVIRQFQQFNAAQLQQQQVSMKNFLEQHHYARMRALDMLQVSEKVKNSNWLNPLLTAGFTLIDNGQMKYKEKFLAGDWFNFKFNR